MRIFNEDVFVIVKHPEKEKKTLEINQLKQKLAETDYKAIKYAEGELTIQEYEETKLQRRSW